MQSVHIDVRPIGAGWWVGCDLPLQPTYFRSGARAEAMARSLAIRLTETGCDVRVSVSDRLDQLIATQRYFAP